MKSVDLKQINKMRKKQNDDLINRMKNGESLKSFDSNSSWFPPRPIIKKDQEAIAKLYKQDETEKNVNNEPNKKNESSNCWLQSS